MRYLTAAFAIITTSLWLGGLVTLAILVMAVFFRSGLDRPTAGRAASAMFVWFGNGQLVVAALALIAVFLGYLQRRGPIAITLFILLAVGAVGAVIFNMYFIKHIEALRQAGQTETPEFNDLHKMSEHFTTGLTAVIFIAALLLPAFCRSLFREEYADADSLPA